MLPAAVVRRRSCPRVSLPCRSVSPSSRAAGRVSGASLAVSRTVAACRAGRRCPASQVWQVGHQNVLRSRVGSAPSEPLRISVPQRRHGRPFAPVHPGRAAGPRVAGEGATGAIAVGADHPGAEIDDGRGIRLGRRSWWAGCRARTGSRSRTRCRTRRRCAGRAARRATARSSAPSRRAASAGIPVRARADRGRGGRRAAPRRAVGTTLMSARSKPTVSHSAVPTIARAVNAGCAPAPAARVDVPLALHLEVRVQRPVADAVQQVLAARDDLVHGHAAQVDRSPPAERAGRSGSPRRPPAPRSAAAPCGRRCRPQARARTPAARHPPSARRSVSPRGDSTKPGIPQRTSDGRAVHERAVDLLDREGGEAPGARGGGEVAAPPRRARPRRR